MVYLTFKKLSMKVCDIVYQIRCVIFPVVCVTCNMFILTCGAVYLNDSCSSPLFTPRSLYQRFSYGACETLSKVSFVLRPEIFFSGLKKDRRKGFVFQQFQRRQGENGLTIPKSLSFSVVKPICPILSCDSGSLSQTSWKEESKNDHSHSVFVNVSGKIMIENLRISWLHINWWEINKKIKVTISVIFVQ